MVYNEFWIILIYIYLKFDMVLSIRDLYKFQNANMNQSRPSTCLRPLLVEGIVYFRIFQIISFFFAHICTSKSRMKLQIHQLGCHLANPRLAGEANHHVLKRAAQPLTAAGSFCHMAASLGSSCSILSSSCSILTSPFFVLSQLWIHHNILRF